MDKLTVMPNGKRYLEGGLRGNAEMVLLKGDTEGGGARVVTLEWWR